MKSKDGGPDGPGGLDSLVEVVSLKAKGRADESRSAFRQLYDWHQESIHTHIRNRACDEDEARQILLLAPEHAWNALPAPAAERDLGAWLLDMATQAIHAYWRESDRNQIRRLCGYLRDGNQRAAEDVYTRLFEKYNPQIYSYILRLITNHRDQERDKEEVAEDLTQIVLIKAWQTIQAIRTWDNFRGWLFTVATNEVFSHWRKQKPWRDIVLGLDIFALVPGRGYALPQTPPAVARICDQDWLGRALATLPEKHRICLLLCKYHGFSAAEAGQILDPAHPVPEGTVNWLVSEAKQLCRKALAESLQDNPPADPPPKQPPRSRRPADVASALEGADVLDPATNDARGALDGHRKHTPRQLAGEHAEQPEGENPRGERPKHAPG